ncbi:MAG: ATPase, P-type (transporting), superfamily, subfamily [Solirubrobacterales bacterium]|nr:ATPase, P-type (transporting), superfamily, subfamily [Solirubrobacterales bacterium]
MSPGASTCSAEAGTVVRDLHSDPSRGLGAGDAQLRLAASGPNELEDRGDAGPWRILWAQLTSPILVLLMGAGVLSAGLGKTAEAAVIGVVVVLNAWIGFRQEHRAERAMASLRAMGTPRAKLLRDGTVELVDAREVVPGDLAVLESGAHVPADGRLLEAHALRVDESALTGESAPVDKQTEPVAASAPLAERASMVYAGTTATAGRGVLVVTATGMDTELGGIAGLLGDADPGRTPLQRRLDTLVRRLAALAGLIVLVVLATGLVRGEPLDTLLLTAVSVAVAAVPESLPAVVTITLALGAQRMLARRALIRRLHAVETLGSVTTICSDKTGTLTQNAMSVVVLDVAGGRREVDPSGPDPGPLRKEPTLALLLAGGVLCNDTVVTEDGTLLGDPTELALLVAARRHGLLAGELRAAFPRLTELPFDAVRKRMTTVHAHGDGFDGLGALLQDGGAVSFTKGAVDGVLAGCDRVSVHGRVVAFDEDLRHRARTAADALAARGVRVLGVATRSWEVGEERPQDERLEQGMTFLGLQGMVDPPRPEVRAAVATCRTAGVRTVMITGDHPLTALAIGHDLGLVPAGARAVTGAELEALGDEALLRTVREVSVYARVSPAHKLRIVEALRRQGQVVAMTGDGVNDAPALKQADIGVAMGITGTDVTKDAADMVLLDDDFKTIVAAVGEGRVVFDNIRKFIRNILSGNVAEVAVMVLAPFLGMPIPLAPLQILWLNLVTDGLPAMALAAEPPEPDVMRRPPTPTGESLLGADRGLRILVRGVALTVLVLVPALLLWRAGNDAWQTVLFSSIAFAELAGGFAMRAEGVSLLRLGPLSNRPLVLAVAVTGGLQVLLVAVPALRELLGLRALGVGEWALVAGVAVSYLLFVELDKAALRRPGR